MKIAGKLPVRSKFTSHWRKIAGHNVYVKQTGAYEYEITVDNSYLTVVQLNRPVTLLNLVEDIIKMFSDQLHLNL